ncbi:MAG: alpha/beta hydrolase [Rikenellaceae bacterium]
MLNYKSLLIAAITLISSTALAQEIKIFPEDFITDKAQYQEHYTENKKGPAGEPNLRLTDVAEPTITFYRAKSNSSTAKTVLVCPGGGYNILSMSLEGTEICEYLNHHGFNAVLLKYRVPRRPGLEKHEAPLEDAQRAMSYLRANAWALGIEGDKIGIMGFSAGAHLSVMCSTAERCYQQQDSADCHPSRPAFTILIYPAYLDGEGFSLAQEVKPSADTPPTFIVQSQDDKSYVNSSIFYYYALKEAGVPATMHLYPNGGHGYGMRKTGAASDGWERELVEWLNTIDL